MQDFINRLLATVLFIFSCFINILMILGVILFWITLFVITLPILYILIPTLAVLVIYLIHTGRL